MLTYSYIKTLITQGLKQLVRVFSPIHETSSPAVAEEAKTGRINDKVAIVYAHGGSWYQGSPDEINAYKGKFPGIHIESVDYTLFPNATNLWQIEEVVKSVKKVKEKYGRVFLMGFSAGGQLAVMASRKIDVEGVICIAGAVNFSATVGLRLIAEVLSGLDPYTYAADDETKTLLIHGLDDKKVLFSGAEKYRERHKNCAMIAVPGKGHTLELLGIESDAIKKWMRL